MVMGREKSAADHLSNLQALKLQQSIHTRDVDQIIKLISNGVPDLVNITDSREGITGVHIAACSNDVETLTLLHGFGADFNVTDNNGRTAYMKAAEYGHFETLEVLLKLCDFPDLDAKDNEGRNILFYCLYHTKRHQLCMKLAMEYGANFHVIAHDGKSLLVKACELKLTEQIKMLLSGGVDVNVKNDQTGETSLHIACKEGLLDVARMLLRNSANPHICDKSGSHCAHQAAKGNHLEILQLLSAYRSNFGTFNVRQETPMHVAALKGYADVCKFLGQRGSPANAKTKKGYTPRTLAKNNGHKAAIKACKKAEKNKGTKSGTQFNIVQFYDWLQENVDFINADVVSLDNNKIGKIKIEVMIRILEKYKSPLDDDTHLEILRAHDKQREGVIDYELFYTGKKFVHKTCLLKNSKKKGKGEGKGGGGKKKAGQTKITLPICTNNRVTQTRLQDGGPLANFIEKQEHVTDRSRFDRNHPPRHQIQDDSFWYVAKYDSTYIHMNEAVRNNDKETIRAAIINGYNINERDQYFKTPLMLACLEGNYELTKFLIDNGADVNIVDNFKWSAIHFSCHSGHTDLVELLLRNGSKIDAPTMNGGTPLMRAIESAQVEVVKLLIDRGADIYLQTKKGLNALQIAKSYSDLRIIEVIEKKIIEMPPPNPRGKASNSPIKLNTNKVGPNTIILPDIKPKEDPPPLRSQQNSLVSAANALNNEKPVTFNVQQAWFPQLNTDELLVEKSKKRERFGYEIDFDDYKPPFQNNVDKILQSVNEVT